MAPVKALGQHPLVVKCKEGRESDSQNDADKRDGDDDNDDVVRDVRLLDLSFVTDQFCRRIHLGCVAVGVASGVAVGVAGGVACGVELVVGVSQNG